MELKKKTMVIGLGNCGCKIAKLFADTGYDAMFANGSAQDLKVLGNIKNIYKLVGFDGFAGHRERAMECLSMNEEFTDALEHIDHKLVFLIYAAGGSTGSGLSSVVAQYLLDVYGDDKIICAVPVLPAENEAITKHRNAYQAIAELMQIDGLGASFILDNSKCSDGNLKWINTSFVSLLNAFLTDDSWGEQNNFDQSERIEMLSENGAMIISVSKDGIGKLLNGNVFAPLQNDMVCGNIGIIHSGKHDVEADTIIAEVGKPANIFEGYNGRGTLIAVSGLSYPIDHVTRLGKLAVDAQKERQRNIDAAKTAMLPTLDFSTTPPQKPTIAPKAKQKPVSGRDALLAMRKQKSAM